MIDDAEHQTRSTRLTSSDRLRAISIPRAVARTVPPSPWIETICAGLPACRAVSARYWATSCSQPSAITTTAPTFG